MTNDRQDEEDEFVRDRLTAAGPGPTLSEGELERIKEAARPVWKQRYCSPARTPWRRWALTAAAVLALGFLFVWSKSEPPRVAPAPAAVARADRVHGSVFAMDADGRNRRPVAQGDTLTVGSILETASDSADARVSVRLVAGQSLRLKPATRVVFSSLLHARLDRGTVYVDSLSALPRTPMRILTSAGDFLPTGTQFEVIALGENVELRVREGIVEFVRAAETTEVSAGERLTIGKDGAIDRGSDQPYGERWDWVLETAPMLVIEGRPLRAFLDWIGREQGLKVEYENPRAASLSETIILHGSISSLNPIEALQSLSMSSGFRYRVADGSLFVAFEEEKE